MWPIHRINWINCPTGWTSLKVLLNLHLLEKIWQQVYWIWNHRQISQLIKWIGVIVRLIKNTLNVPIALNLNLCDERLLVRSHCPIVWKLLLLFYSWPYFYIDIFYLILFVLQKFLNSWTWSPPKKLGPISV